MLMTLAAESPRVRWKLVSSLGRDFWKLPTWEICDYVFAICTQNMGIEQIEDFEKLLDPKETDILKLPKMRDGESVYDYRTRNHDRILNRSKAIRSLEDDLFGDDLDWVMGPGSEEEE